MTIESILHATSALEQPKTIRSGAFNLDGEHYPTCDELDNIGLGWKFDRPPSVDEGAVVNIVRVFFYQGTKQIADLPPSILTDAFIEGMEAEIAESEDVKAMTERMEANERRREDRDGYGDWLLDQRKDREASR